MSADRMNGFREERARLQELMLRYSGKNMKRFLNIDHNAYEPGALPKPAKELMGLVASLVLRCEDCILYHLQQCHDQGVTTAELEESLTVALVVGGSITIPHIRRVLQAWAELGHAPPGGSE
ncbi:MAG: carboxymuconolactone decarboxylase family protein [Acidobacteria bacterium]|nr:carboxymuconolactone decarboxylase family protein [Acidobacteriota bacterium]